MKYLLLIFLFGGFSYSGHCQVKKIPTIKGDTLDFPKDFRNRTRFKIGDTLPLFNYLDIEGDTITSTDFKDKLLVLNFWFVGCVGCKQEEPYLARMTEKLKGENVSFVSICQSSNSRTKSYIKKNGYFGYKVISVKSKKEIVEKFDVRTFPTHILVKNGTVIENFSFPLTDDDEIDWFERRIRNEINNGM